MPGDSTPREGQILRGSLFSEPMRVETIRPSGDGTWVLGLVGIQTERFRKVALGSQDLESLTITDTKYRYDGDGNLLRLHAVTNCTTNPSLQEPIKDPARLEWHEVTKVAHYCLSVNAIANPMHVREDRSPMEKRNHEILFRNLG